ncbi:MAG: exo-alpha-sialidase [Verrucomicrobiales bacterium]|nr:exo-alpha-sialidase [Verrucomicrobiales bacterium]
MRRPRPSLLAPCALLLRACLPLSDAGAAEVPSLGDRRELFVDRALLERLNGIELRLGSPQPAGSVFHFDRPWEGIVSGYVTVLQDGARRLLYYRGRPSVSRGDASDEAREVSCVAESADGITWTRPNLGFHEVAGTRENNVFLVQPKSVTHNFCPFLDSRPGVPAAERFKAVGGTGAGGLFGYVSPDGLRWTPVSDQPLITQGQFDSQNIVFWSEHEQAYLCYFRTWEHDVRWVARATSPDFKTWSAPVSMDFGEAPPEHIYISQTQPYFRAPHLYLGIAARFQPGRRALSDDQVAALDLRDPRNYEQLEADVSDAVLLSSRGGHRYDRTFLESFIRPGPDARNWVARANYPALGMLQTGATELSLYVVRHYGQPSIHLERFTLRLDGFASAHADFRGGELLTRPFTFQGSRLELNLATSAGGSARVELQDEHGAPLPGFTLADSPEIITDAVQHEVRWKTDADLGAWSGKPVRLRVALRDADLFSFRFHAAPPAKVTVPAPDRPFVTVCSEGGAGGYEAFPDVCRLADGRLFCVFYASYTHVGVPSREWPLGGRISACWSTNEGRSWSRPVTLLDTPADDRDPSITSLRDGHLATTFFTQSGIHWAESTSPAGPWSEPRPIARDLGVSSPIRELKDGTLVLGGYFERGDKAHGTIHRSSDSGRTWDPPVAIDSAGQFLDAETDVLELANGTLFAALRGGRGAALHESRSLDQGRTWTPARSLGFNGHCPYLHRTPDGHVVLAYRQPDAGPTRGTALRVSGDDTVTWSEAVPVDAVIGAYPSLVNLRDGSTLIVYYEEGAGSDIRARKFKVEGNAVHWLGW